LEINRADARQLAIGDADFVEITSRRGKAMLQARVTGRINCWRIPAGVMTIAQQSIIMLINNWASAVNHPA
jgi:anaerobic selenocysteine-containing dehydrogenase